MEVPSSLNFLFLGPPSSTSDGVENMGELDVLSIERDSGGAEDVPGLNIGGMVPVEGPGSPLKIQTTTVVV